jgi:hypothetical protein
VKSQGNAHQGTEENERQEQEQGQGREEADQAGEALAQAREV